MWGNWRDNKSNTKKQKNWCLSRRVDWNWRDKLNWRDNISYTNNRKVMFFCRRVDWNWCVWHSPSPSPAWTRCPRVTWAMFWWQCIHSGIWAHLPAGKGWSQKCLGGERGTAGSCWVWVWGWQTSTWTLNLNAGKHFSSSPHFYTWLNPDLVLDFSSSDTVVRTCSLENLGWIHFFLLCLPQFKAVVTGRRHRDLEAKLCSPLGFLL